MLSRGVAAHTVDYGINSAVGVGVKAVLVVRAAHAGVGGRCPAKVCCNRHSASLARNCNERQQRDRDDYRHEQYRPAKEEILHHAASQRRSITPARLMVARFGSSAEAFCPTGLPFTAVPNWLTSSIVKRFVSGSRRIRQCSRDTSGEVSSLRSTQYDR